MNEAKWMSDERIAHIDKEKIDFLQKLVFEIDTLSQKEKMPFLMALAGKARSEHISFSNEEINLLVTVVKDYSTPLEINKMDKLLKMFPSK